VVSNPNWRTCLCVLDCHNDMCDTLKGGKGWTRQ